MRSASLKAGKRATGVASSTLCLLLISGVLLYSGIAKYYGNAGEDAGSLEAFSGKVKVDDNNVMEMIIDYPSLERAAASRTPGEEVVAEECEGCEGGLRRAEPKAAVEPLGATAPGGGQRTLKPQKQQESDEVFSPALEFQGIINTSPVVVFARGEHPDSVYLVNLLQAEYAVTPQIAVVDLDKHKHGVELQKYISLNKLHVYSTNYNSDDDVPDVPYLFVNGISVINVSLQKDIKDKHAAGALLARLQSLAGGKVGFERLSPPSNS